MKKTDGMTFCGDLPKTWEFAERFAGPEGRVATLPDIIAARLASPPGKGVAWNFYTTTTSAEFAGRSKSGRLVVIVAHDDHPLAKRTRAVKIYESSSGRDVRGTRIPREDFLKLEAGHYGNVSIVPLEEIARRYEYPFMGGLSLAQIEKEPLMHARLGPRWEEYANAHDKLAREYHKERGLRPQTPLILEMDCPNKAWYVLRGLKERDQFEFLYGLGDEQAFAHLLGADQVTNMLYSGKGVPFDPQPVSSIGVHESGNTTRFLGLRKGADLGKVAEATSSYNLLEKHWRDLLVLAKGKKAPLRRIEDFGGEWFTQKLKGDGHEMDTGIREHPVKKVKKLGSGAFKTKIRGYYGFLRYSIKDVQAIAPEGANAYTLGDTGFTDGNKEEHFINVTFYQAEIDLKRRLMTASELEDDFDLYVKFASIR